MYLFIFALAFQWENYVEDLLLVVDVDCDL